MSGHIITQVAAGDEHTVLLTSEGAVLTFGKNENGRTGHGTTEGNQTTPRIVGGCLEGKRVVYVAAGDAHTACIDEDGDLYTWGKGKYGRLGHGNERNLSSPKLVEVMVGKKCSSVACGGHHTLIIAEKGKVYSCGQGNNGQLGHCDTENRLKPTLIKAPFEGRIIEQVACGFTHSMALCPEGILYTWGTGEHGRLGHGSESQYSFPSNVQSLYTFV